MDRLLTILKLSQPTQFMIRSTKTEEKKIHFYFSKRMQKKAHLSKGKQVSEGFARASVRPQNDALLFQNGRDANALYLSGNFNSHFPNSPHDLLTQSQLLEARNRLLLLLRFGGGGGGCGCGGDLLLLPRFGGGLRGVTEVSGPEPLEEY